MIKLFIAVLLLLTGGNTATKTPDTDKSSHQEHYKATEYVDIDTPVQKNPKRKVHKKYVQYVDLDIEDGSSPSPTRKRHQKYVQCVDFDTDEQEIGKDKDNAGN